MFKFDDERFLETIETKEDFLTFLEWMAKDFWDDMDSWQNRDMDRYLRSIASWLEDSPQMSVKEGAKFWQSVAHMFYAGKIYE